MKKIIYFTLMAIVASCTNDNSQIRYNIAVTTDSSIEDGATAYLYTYNQNQPIDSAVVANCKLSFSDTIAQPSIMRIDLQRSYANVLVGNSDEISVSMSLNQPSAVSDNGGLNDRYTVINEGVQSKLPILRERYMTLLDEGLSSAEAMKKIDAVSFTGIERSIIENKDNLVGLMLLWQMLQLETPTLSKTDSLIRLVRFSDNMKPIANIRENIAMAEKTQEGKMFVDFEGQDIDGESIKLSDYVGKGRYVLVDFWASWCGPCMAELPHLKEAYEKFNGDKFTVVGINVWDKKAPFKRSVKDKQMPWSQIFTVGQEATNLYGVQGIPALILFAPDGTILKRGEDIRGEKLTKYIKKILIF